MASESFFEEIYSYISKSQTSEAIRHLEKLNSTSDLNSEIDISIEIALVSAQFEDFQAKKRLGTISIDDERRFFNIINKSILDVSRRAFTNNLGNRIIQVPSEVRSDVDEIVHNKLYDVFLCYSNEDIRIAREVYLELTNAGKRVFFSEEMLKNVSNKSYFKEISKGLQISKSFLFIS